MSIPTWPEKRPPLIASALADLLECACDAVANLGAGAACLCEITAGDQAQWIGCAECDSASCGMVFVRPGEAFRYTSFPIPDDNNTRLGCAGSFAHEIEVGVVRCFPTMEAGGEGPDAGALTDATLSLLDDQRALLIAIECCDSPHLKNKALAEWSTVGPTGGCIQGSWRLYVDPVV